jgi:hypothetical protein
VIVRQPYRELWFNNLETASLACATFVVHTGLLFRAVDSTSAAARCSALRCATGSEEYTGCPPRRRIERGEGGGLRLV